VGLKNLRRYFRCVRAVLRPGGVLLNHGIARATTSAPRANSFIDQYVFPDGRLVTLPQAMDAAEAEALEVRDVENLREHYNITLRRWVEGLEAHRERLLRLVTEETYRIWLLYMAGCAAAFGRGNIAVYQTLLSRAARGKSHLPLTREDWFLGRSERMAA
jgi:cyclopropane-fatty-acyl-phospholipid synthase